MRVFRNESKNTCWETKGGMEIIDFNLTGQIWGMPVNLTSHAINGSPIYDNFAAILALFGVIIGVGLTFLSQLLLLKYQEKSELRKNAIALKNKECLTLWRTFSDVYHYIYFSGSYSEDKIDVTGLGKHIKKINTTIIGVEPFISEQNFKVLLGVKDSINEFFGELEAGEGLSYNEMMVNIIKLENPMNAARDILRDELKLITLECTPQM